MYFWISAPFYDPYFFRSARRRSPAERWWKLWFFENSSHCVPLPEPGPPSTKMTVGLWACMLFVKYLNSDILIFLFKSIELFPSSFIILDSDRQEHENKLANLSDFVGHNIGLVPVEANLLEMGSEYLRRSQHISRHNPINPYNKSHRIGESFIKPLLSWQLPLILPILNKITPIHYKICSPCLCSSQRILFLNNILRLRHPLNNISKQLKNSHNQQHVQDLFSKCDKFISK